MWSKEAQKATKILGFFIPKIYDQKLLKSPNLATLLGKHKTAKFWIDFEIDFEELTWARAY